MKKVLIVADRVYGGGAERVLVDLINSMPENEFQITLYTLQKDKIEKSGLERQLDYRCIYENSACYGYPKKLFARLRNRKKAKVYENKSAQRFYDLVIKEKYDVEIAAIEGYATRIISGSTNKDSLKIAWLHTDLDNNHWSKIAFKSDAQEADAYKRFDRVVCVTKNVEDILLKKFGKDINTVVVPNPLKQDRVLKLSETVDNTVSLKEKGEGVFRIAYLGRLKSEKGADRLLKAFKRALDIGRNMELFVIGDGEQSKELKQYAADNGLNDAVTFFGYLDNPYYYMKNCDLFVCPSRAEGFGLVLVEAMFLSLPVMSTDCAGPREILDGGKYGLLTENSEDGIYEGIIKLYDDRELLKKYSELSVKRRDDYGYESSTGKFIEIIDSGK